MYSLNLILEGKKKKDKYNGALREKFATSLFSNLLRELQNFLKPVNVKKFSNIYRYIKKYSSQEI